MSMSKEDIFNKSLGLIGGPNQTSYIDNAETNDSHQAIWLRIVYVSSLDYCAIDLKPGIFTLFKDLDKATTDPEKLDWEYAFDKPSESIQLVRLTQQDDRSMSHDYKDMGLYYFCDYETPIAEIITSPEGSDLTTWPVGFSNMVAARMAVEVGGIWKPEILAAATAKYDDARREAFETQPESYREPTPIWNQNT